MGQGSLVRFLARLPPFERAKGSRASTLIAPEQNQQYRYEEQGREKERQRPGIPWKRPREMVVQPRQEDTQQTKEEEANW